MGPELISALLLAARRRQEAQGIVSFDWREGTDANDRVYYVAEADGCKLIVRATWRERSYTTWAWRVVNAALPDARRPIASGEVGTERFSPPDWQSRVALAKARAEDVVRGRIRDRLRGRQNDAARRARKVEKKAAKNARKKNR